MQNKCKKFRLWSILLLVMLMAAGFTCHSTSRDVQAATKNGFRTVKGKTYYYKNGKKVKGWLTLNGKKYYFSKSTGVQAKGWVKDKKGRKRYFTSKAGVMVTGWLSNSKRQRRYFAPSTGYMKTKWLKLGGKTYYLYAKSGVAATGFVKDSKGNIRYFSKTGIMATGWLTSSSGVKRYFASTSSTSTNGIMAVGFKTINNVTYYFYSGSGAMATGWVENTDKGTKYYFDPTTGAMYTGTQTIDGVTYVFSDTGVCQGEKQNDPTPDGNTGSKTIKNYLADQITVPRFSTDLPEFAEAEKAVQAKIDKFMSIQGKESVDSIHKKLGHIMWEYVGMGRTAEGLKKGIAELKAVRKEFETNLFIPGSQDGMNVELDKALRTYYFITMGAPVA